MKPCTLGKDAGMKFSHLHLHRAREIGLQGVIAGSGWDGLHALPHPQALSVEKWWKLDPYQKKSGILNIPSHSPLWQRCGVTTQQNRKCTLPPPLCKHWSLCSSSYIQSENRGHLLTSAISVQVSPTEHLSFQE